MLLGLLVEHGTGRPPAEVLRSGVLDGDGYQRLIYQPDERPTDPMALPSDASADTFDQGGGFLPSLANGCTTLALCFPNQGIVVVVLAHAEHDVDILAGILVQAASS